jgi:hypothetical protein
MTKARPPSKSITKLRPDCMRKKSTEHSFEEESIILDESSIHVNQIKENNYLMKIQSVCSHTGLENQL